MKNKPKYSRDGAVKLLAAAVFGRAAKDINSRKEKIRDDIEEWIDSDNYEFWCDILDMHPERVAAVLKEKRRK